MLKNDISFEVSCCLPQFQADISSNIAFQVAASIRQQLQVSIDPLKIAELLLRSLAELNNASLFHIETGGLGYLNATPTSLFIETFWSKVIERGVSLLFFKKAFVIALHAQSMKAGDGTDFKMKIDWGRLLKQERLRSVNSDVLHLLEKCKTRGEISFNDTLMLLALLGNPDLELDPYLLGLGGSQNIPWYIQRFLADAKNLTQNCQQQLEKRFFSQKRSGFILPLFESHMSMGRKQVPDLLATNLRQVLGFRQWTFHEHQVRRPVLYVRYLLEIIKSFYSFYHHPRSRELPTKVENFEVLEVLTNVVLIIRDLVEQGVSALVPKQVDLGRQNGEGLDFKEFVRRGG